MQTYVSPASEQSSRRSSLAYSLCRSPRRRCVFPQYSARHDGSHIPADVRIDLEKSLPPECGARLSTYRNKTSEILPPPANVFHLSETKKDSETSATEIKPQGSRTIWNGKCGTSCKQIAKNKLRQTKKKSITSHSRADPALTLRPRPLATRLGGAHECFPCCPGGSKMSQPRPFDL